MLSLRVWSATFSVFAYLAKRRLTLRAAVAAITLSALLAGSFAAVAGTTGGLAGVVTDATTKAGVANAKVTAVSASQTATTTTDAQGHYIFASLAPDTYTVSVEQQAYASLSASGINVLADQTQNVPFVFQHQLRTISRVTAAAAGNLVSRGTTGDTYSVNASTAARIGALGGGGSLNQVYSQVASVPGVYVPPGANGWNQTILIRGGDYNQVGYEYDGIPVNRSFDNYPAGTASALGNQELQVYTGGAPASSNATGLAGYINQVIKTGTYPGTTEGDISFGAPTFYHKLNFEMGGATPNRNFSYYAGFGGYNQQFRAVDNFNGNTQLQQFGTPYDLFGCPAAAVSSLASCYADKGVTAGPGITVGPGGYQFAPINTGSVPATIADREGVVNLVLGLPHKHDGLKDNIQALYSVGAIQTQFYDSPGDYGQTQLLAANPNGLYRGGAPVAFTTSSNYTGPVGTFYPANGASLIKPYTFPQAASFADNLLIPNDYRDGDWNDQAIIKLQYQHNFSSAAYARVYGYTFYSDWLENGPNSLAGFGVGPPGDYELNTHSRGLNLDFGDQVNAHNLLTANASYTTSTTLRDYNTQANGDNGGTQFAFLVNRNDPTNGTCYAATGGAAKPVSCYDSADVTALTFAAPKAPSLVGQTCGGGPCAFYVAENGQNATYNQVVPNFWSGAISDQIRPTDRLLLSLGLHYDDYQFVGANTDTGARAFWFNAWNASSCVAAAPGSVPTGNGRVPGTACPAGNSPALLFNTQASYNYPLFEPRFGSTFTLDPDTVLRASYGRYSQPSNAASEQYNVLQQNLPGYIGPKFYSIGYDTPGHPIPPEVSYNLDASIEHHFHGTDASLKITPFLRKTSGEQTTVFIDPRHAVVSSLPVGDLTSRGIEFAFSKGNFDRNGFAGQLAYTYTYATIMYSPLGNGSTVIDPINNDIKNYNAYTSGCAPGGAAAKAGLCGVTSSGAAAAPCYGAAGAAIACTAPGAVANPYWDAPAQGLLDRSGPYFPTDTVVSTYGLNSGNSYLTPHTATLILHYKKNRFEVTPSLQFSAGQRYGTPESQVGIDPTSGCAALAEKPDAGRYPYGSAGGSGYNALSCGATIVTPDSVTGKFDNVGAFAAPSELLLNTQIAFQVTPKARLTLTLANLMNQCFGGTSEPWTGNGTRQTCSYDATSFAFVSPAGNIYNPGDKIQAYTKYPYVPTYGVYNPDVNGGLFQPFSAYLDVSFKV
jgi:hypothetical protein